MNIKTKSLHLCQITIGILYKFTHLKSIENKNIHRLWSVFFGVTPHLNYFLLCHCQHILPFINIVRIIAILIFDGLRLSGIERSNYIESNNLGKKSCPVSGIEDSVFRVFYHIKNRSETFGTDEIVRFHGDFGIERIRFRGFLLYIRNMAHRKYICN